MIKVNSSPWWWISQRSSTRRWIRFRSSISTVSIMYASCTGNCHWVPLNWDQNWTHKWSTSFQFQLTKCVCFYCSTSIKNSHTIKFVSLSKSRPQNCSCIWSPWSSVNSWASSLPRTRFSWRINSVWTWTTNQIWLGTRSVSWFLNTLKRQIMRKFSRRSKMIVDSQLMLQSWKSWSHVARLTISSWSLRRLSWCRRGLSLTLFRLNRGSSI